MEEEKGKICLIDVLLSVGCKLTMDGSKPREYQVGKNPPNEHVFIHFVWTEE